MARDLGPKCRICRREGVKLFLKGERCLTEKCAVERRSYPPGEHGRGRIKQSQYLLQLREKQKARRYYGLLEKQFRSTYEKASRGLGAPGENLLRMLETRLDNVVYRLGFAGSRAQSRQIVRHGHFQVNGRRVNIPSFQVKAGDVIEVKDKSKQLEVVVVASQLAERDVPDYIEVDHSKMTARVTRIPTLSEVPYAVQMEPNLVIEFYSR
jgi:small subunit ribosomal protein S4